MFFEAFFLIDRIVQLAVCVCQFFAVHHQLEAFGQSRFAAVHFGQRTHFHRVIGDECRLYECTFTEFTEDFVYQLAFAHGIVNFHFQFAAYLTDFLFALAVEVIAGLFLDGIQDRQAAVRSLETDGLAVNRCFRSSVYSNANTLKQLLGEAHHPIVIFILHIQFHASEFRVMVLVHTFVAEVFSDFVHTFKTAYD